MTAPATSRRERRARREGRRSTALFIGTVILLVVALGAVGAALVVRHDTTELQSRAVPVRQEVRELTATEASAERRVGLIRTRAHAVNVALTALFAAEVAQVDASNHAVDVANQAVDQYDNAQATAVAAAFQAAGDAALADLEQKTTALRGAADAAQQAIGALQAAVNG